MAEATAAPPRRARLGRNGRIGVAVAAVLVAGLGARLAWQRLSIWQDRPVEQLAVFDDEAALLRRESVDGDRVQISRVDGSGTAMWTKVFEWPELASSSERMVIPLADAGVATLGTLVGISLEDGRELWRHPRPRRAEGCRTFIREEGMLFAACAGLLLAIDPKTGAERWKVPLVARPFRWFSGAKGEIDLDADEGDEPALTVDIASGKTTKLSSRICDTGGARLSFDGHRVTAQSLSDAGSTRSAELDTPEVPSLSCGTFGSAFVLGHGTKRKARLLALDRETLALRWSLEIPIEHPSAIDGVRGSLLALDDPLPKMLPVRVAGAIYLVDLTTGQVAASRVVPGIEIGLAAGVAVHEGRAYELATGNITLFGDATSATTASYVSSVDEIDFSKSFVWLLKEGRLGRLRASDLTAAPGSEKLAETPTEIVYGAAR